MYYSVTFINSSGVKKNTWADWRMIPSSPPMIETPEPQTNYVEIPGRKTGPLDLSEVLSDGPCYQNSEGSWEFICHDSAQPRTVLFQLLKDFLHGKALKVVLEEDPSHYYTGRFTVSKPSTGNHNATFAINYVIAPVRYKLDGTQEGL